MDWDPEPEEDNQVELKREDHTLFRISNTDDFIMTRRTLLGLRFEHIFRKLDDPSSEEGYLVDPIVPCMSSEELKPFMIYPRIMLQRRSMPSVETNVPNIVERWLLKKVFGTAVIEPRLEVICCILLELNRLSDSRCICVNDCRYVLEECGYELTPLWNQLAQLRIQAEHEEYYGKALRRRRQLQHQTQVHESMNRTFIRCFYVFSPIGGNIKIGLGPFPRNGVTPIDPNRVCHSEPSYL